MARRNRGFTLIELLAVVFILGVGLSGISALFVAGIISSSKSRRMSTAIETAQKQMERIRSAGYGGCVVDDEIFTADAGYTLLEQNTDGTGRIGFSVPSLPNGQGEIDIRFYNSGSGTYPNLKDVTVSVTWTGGKPTAGRTVLRALVANRP